MALLGLTSRLLAPLHAQDSEPGMSPVLKSLGDLWEYERAGRPSSRHLSFEFPETYINGYLAASLKLKPRPGLASLSVQLLPGNRIVATAEVDLQRLLASDPRVVPSGLISKLTSAGFLKAEFSFRVKSGRVTFTVKPVASGGLSVPNHVLDRIVRGIASIQPEGLDIRKPIPLPWGMKTLYTRANLLGGGT